MFLSIYIFILWTNHRNCVLCGVFDADDVFVLQRFFGIFLNYVSLNVASNSMVTTVRTYYHTSCDVFDQTCLMVTVDHKRQKGLGPKQSLVFVAFADEAN